MVQQFLAWAIGKNPLKLRKMLIYMEIPLVGIYTKSKCYINFLRYIYGHTNL